MLLALSVFLFNSQTMNIVHRLQWPSSYWNVDALRVLRPQHSLQIPVFFSRNRGGIHRRGLPKLWFGFVGRIQASPMASPIPVRLFDAVPYSATSQSQNMPLHDELDYDQARMMSVQKMNVQNGLEQAVEKLITNVPSRDCIQKLQDRKGIVVFPHLKEKIVHPGLY